MCHIRRKGFMRSSVHPSVLRVLAHGESAFVGINKVLEVNPSVLHSPIKSLLNICGLYIRDKLLLVASETCKGSNATHRLSRDIVINSELLCPDVSVLIDIRKYRTLLRAQGSGLLGTWRRSGGPRGVHSAIRKDIAIDDAVDRPWRSAKVSSDSCRGFAGFKLTHNSPSVVGRQSQARHG